MASVILKRLPNSGIQTQYSAEFSRMGKGLKRRPQFTSQQMECLEPGQRGYFPRGTDTDTPGYVKKQK